MPEKEKSWWEQTWQDYQNKYNLSGASTPNYVDPAPGQFMGDYGIPVQPQTMSEFNSTTPGLNGEFGAMGTQTDFTNFNGVSANSGAMPGSKFSEPGFSNGWGFSGSKDSLGNVSSGWGAPATGVFNAGMNAYLGLKQLKLAKDSLAFQKDAFSKQFENQRTLTNAQLRDRQKARDSATGQNTVGAYMAQNGV